MPRYIDADALLDDITPGKIVSSDSVRYKIIAAPTVKPDRDNVEKLVCDALNGVAYDDDKCVVDGRTRKLYADTPRIEIRVKEWIP